MQFQYTAKTTVGQTSSGMIEAASLSEARQQLREQGLFILSLATQRAAAFRSGKRRLTFSRSGVKKVEVLMLTSQLAIMCQTGVDLAEALQNLAEQCPNPTLKKILDAVYQDVSSGIPVSVAMKKHSHIFGDAYVASIAAAEASGTMTEVLIRLADLLRNDIRLRSTLRSALAYPIVLGVVALGVVAALVLFVLPQFSKVFIDMGTPAPPMTQMLMDAANALRDNFFILLAVCGGGVWALSRFWSTDRGSHFWDGLVLNTVLIRNATQPLLLGRMFRLLGTMLQSGIPLLEAIRLCRSSVQNRYYRDLFDSLEQNVINGEGLAKALSAAQFVPSGAKQMVITAERTGKLGTVMQSVGEFYEDEGERQVHELAKLLEPAIIVFMGVIVAFVVLSIMLPLLDVSTMSH